jgi:iron(III) transport system substrate-binding protein
MALSLALILPAAAQAQPWQDDWNATLAKAKGQTLVAMTAAEDAYATVLTEFSKKFGIKTETTVARPSAALARLQTEQKAGQFGWDIWMGGTSNMVNSASPAGLLAPMEPFFILPEVKEPANWRHSDYIFGDSKRSVFTNVNRLEFYVLRNMAVLPNVKIETWDDFLNPALKDKISMRDLSVPNGGTFAMATAYALKGEGFLRKLLKDQDVNIYENPQQLENAITRGGQAVSIGVESFVWDKCRADGGCKTIEPLRNFATVTSSGFTILKSPPHVEAVKIFTNWFLSREGQQVLVNGRAKQNNTGAVSMRKDVAPFEGQESSLPDFSDPKKYVFVSSEHGSEEIEATIKIFKEVTGH